MSEQLAEEVAVHLQLRQRVAELPDGRARGVVDQHLLGPRLGRDVVHERDALVEEVPAAASGGRAASGRSGCAATRGRR